MTSAALDKCVAVLKRQVAETPLDAANVLELEPPYVPDHGVYGVIFTPRNAAACSLEITINPAEFHVLLAGDMWVSEVPLDAELLRNICNAVRSGKVRRTERHVGSQILDSGGVIECEPEPVYLFADQGRGLFQSIGHPSSARTATETEQTYSSW